MSNNIEHRAFWEKRGFQSNVQVIHIPHSEPEVFNGTTPPRNIYGNGLGLDGEHLSDRERFNMVKSFDLIHNLVFSDLRFCDSLDCNCFRNHKENKCVKCGKENNA